MHADTGDQIVIGTGAQRRTGAPATRDATPPPRELPRRRTRPAPVVVGVDGSRCSLRAVAAAAVEAERRGAPLRLVHALPPGPEDPRRVDALLAGAARVALFSTTSAATSLVVTAGVVTGPPVTALLEAAREAAVLVVGRGGGPDGPGPVAAQLRLRATGPLLVVPPAARACPGTPVPSRRRLAVRGAGREPVGATP